MSEEQWARLRSWVDMDGLDLDLDVEAHLEQVAGALLNVFWTDNEPEAFELLVLLTQKRLGVIAGSITRRVGVLLDPYDLVATLFQRLFIDVYGNRQGVQHFFAFAHTSMRNEALNQLRKLARASNRHIIYETEHRDVSPPPDPAIVAENRETERDLFRRAALYLTIVNACFHGLRERDRRVLMAREADDLTYDEIADTLGLPRNQLGMILKRARERLDRSVGLALHEIEARTGTDG